MGLRQILAACPFPFIKIGNGVETEPIDTHGEPKIAHFLDCLMHGCIVEIQIWLVRIKAMPVISFCHRVPRPVGCFEIFENDARVLVFFWRVAPDIELAFG